MNHVNPEIPGDTSLGLVLWALSAKFAFISLPAELEAGVASVAGQVPTALQQAPGLRKALLPTGSLDSEYKQLTDIESSMGDVPQQFQINVANTLNATQNDYPVFSSLTNNSSFIAKHASSECVDSRHHKDPEYLNRFPSTTSK